MGKTPVKEGEDESVGNWREGRKEEQKLLRLIKINFV